MTDLNLADVADYVSKNIGDFHANRLQKLNDLKLNEVLRHKNPYLFKAKNLMTAEALIRRIVDAYLSSQEETIFGDFLESVAVFVCGKVYGGYKPQVGVIEGIDLIFGRDSRVYIVEIKSGPYRGNSSQIKKMTQNFQAAIDILSDQYADKEIISVNGCSYGMDSKPYNSGKMAVNTGSHAGKTFGVSYQGMMIYTQRLLSHWVTMQKSTMRILKNLMLVSSIGSL